MKCCLQKDFFKHTPGKKRKEDSMSSQKKKGMTLERKQNLTGWAFLKQHLLLSDYSGADHADPRPDVCFHAEQQRSAF